MRALEPVAASSSGSLDDNRSHVPHTVSTLARLTLVLSLAISPAIPAALQTRIEKLPVTEGNDIRFTQLSIGGQSFQFGATAITQDKYGFMWFATAHGLYRYDGYNARPYQHEQGNDNSLSDDVVKVLYRDRAGILWIGTGFGGLDRLDPATGAITHYRHNPANGASLSDNTIGAIYQDASGVLWVGSNGGLDRMDPRAGTFVHYVHNPRDAGSLSSNIVAQISEDHSGNLWVGTLGGGLNMLDRTAGTFSHYEPDVSSSPGSGRSQALDRMHADHEGVLWVGYTLGTLSPKTGLLTTYAFASNGSGNETISNIRAILEDRTGVLWVATREGLLALDRERKHITRYTTNPANPHSLHYNDVISLFEDAEGNIWAGTQVGVTRFNRKSAFVSWQHEAANTNSLADNTVRAVYADHDGTIWVSTPGGLQRLDPKTGRFTLYTHNPRDAHSLSDDDVTFVREDRSGTVWVGTRSGGLDRFDPTAGRFFAYRYQPNRPDGLSSDDILSMFEDRDGVIWLATGVGLDRYDRRTNRFTTYLHNPADPHSLSDSVIKIVIQDHTGVLWVGTNNGGLNRFDAATQQFTTFRHNSADPLSLSHDKVNSMLEDRAGTLWIGTQNGLDRMDPERGTFTAFTRKNGMSDDAVQSIQEDDHGNLWLATDNGLSRFDPRTRTFTNYSELHGLPANALAQNGVEGSSRAPDGQMWFGSVNGLTSFYPDHISPNLYVPPVVLTDLLLSNTSVIPGPRSVLRKPIWAIDRLTLDHTHNIFSLEFSALSYVAPEKNRYRYRLEGLDPQWNEVDSTRHLATYTDLPPNRYIFSVQGSNNDGLWNDVGVRLVIMVLPPWWQTWWFTTVAIFTVAGVVFAVHRDRVRVLELAAAGLERQVAERTSELAAATHSAESARDAAETANRAKSAFLAHMSHELRTPLNAILGFSGLVASDPGLSAQHRRDLNIVGSSGRHLLQLIDDVLDTAKIEAGGAVAEITPFDLHAMLHDVVDLMRERAGAKDLDLLLDISPAAPRFVRSDPDKLGQVLTNLIANAVKYTEQGGVVVRLGANAGSNEKVLTLIFEVEDTGIGIAADDRDRIFDPFVQAGKGRSTKGTGLGLSISKRFVELLGGALTLESTPGQGSCFRVGIPAEKAEASEVNVEAPRTDQVVGLEPGQPDYRILIVEDREESSLLLERLLRSATFQVRTATDGAEAIQIFQEWRPHFIWMDMRLPVMGGLEASARIRTMEGGGDVKIVAVTASVFASQREEVLVAGLDDFLRKPWRPQEILDCMVRHLGVRFVYSSAQQPVHQPPATVNAADFASLPEELRQTLENAIIALDPHRIAQAISQVSEHDAALGKVLSSLAANLAYTAIFDALESCKTKI